MPAVTVTATIAAGQSLSNAVDVTTGEILRIVMPDEWTPANISFQLSTLNDEAQFRDVAYVGNGREIVIGCVPGHVVALGADTDFAREGFLKLRSGTAAAPVLQEADRSFQLVILKGATGEFAP